MTSSSRASREQPAKKDASRSDAGEEVVIVDEFAEVEAADPFFAGFRRGPAFEEAYERLVRELREAHQRRFRHAPPADPNELFAELEGELFLPHASEIGSFLRAVREHGRPPKELEERVFTVLEEFLRALRGA